MVLQNTNAMKKFAIYPCIIVVFSVNFLTSCTSDGTIDFNIPEVIPIPLGGTLDSVRSTAWTKPDSTGWYVWESVDSLKTAGAFLMLISYNNTVEQWAYVRATDRADTPHLLPYNIGSYEISFTSDGIHISENYKDTTGTLSDLIKTLEFRGFVVPSQKCSSTLDYNDYNAVCKFYNVEP